MCDVFQALLPRSGSVVEATSPDLSTATQSVVDAHESPENPLDSILAGTPHTHRLAARAARAVAAALHSNAIERPTTVRAVMDFNICHGLRRRHNG
jgi:hypothetical protein